ncbi:hypothetical protein H4CHR_01567 [Variovorax sp. PBS-H4]|uniref:hypothetical protein n=1 Tax=Variovorax sp. PBS-H4 TaxID=434008 RepID=UPI00131943DB|nr:hypothetical protein [Variovorax sp. PBS-H4]VTU25303.1 hypothetical protein H4CHR_01567 [Variovorax sp. PBS-H4]
MGRTAAPATPGTDPAAAPAPEDGVPAVPETPEEKVARLEREMADMKALVQSIGRNQAVQHQPAVALPELADIMAKKPDFSVLTKQGWYVPAVLPSQRTGSGA